MNYLLNIYFNLRWQAKFRRGSNKTAGWQAKKQAGSMKKMGKKILAPAAKKKKMWGANFNSAPAGNIVIPRGFFNLVSGLRHRGALGFAPL